MAWFSLPDPGVQLRATAEALGQAIRSVATEAGVTEQALAPTLEDASHLLTDGVQTLIQTAQALQQEVVAGSGSLVNTFAVLETQWNTYGTAITLGLTVASLVFPAVAPLAMALACAKLGQGSCEVVDAVQTRNWDALLGGVADIGGALTGGLAGLIGKSALGAARILVMASTLGRDISAWARGAADVLAKLEQQDLSGAVAALAGLGALASEALSQQAARLSDRMLARAGWLTRYAHRFLGSHPALMAQARLQLAEGIRTLRRLDRQAQMLSRSFLAEIVSSIPDPRTAPPITARVALAACFSKQYRWTEGKFASQTLMELIRHFENPQAFQADLDQLLDPVPDLLDLG